MTSRRASCSCGQLSVVCEGDPIRISVCHCLACQKRTGSVFAAQARWPIERVRSEGRASEWARIGDSGGKGTFRFCPTCGAIVYWLFSEPDAAPEFIVVPIGAFADPSFPPPAVSVYEARMHSWVRMPENIEHMD